MKHKISYLGRLRLFNLLRELTEVSVDWPELDRDSLPPFEALRCDAEEARETPIT